MQAITSRVIQPFPGRFQVPATIDLDQFQSDVAPFSYDCERADIRAGFDVNAADLKRALAEGEEITSGVFDSSSE